MDSLPAPARLWLLATGHFLPRCLHVVAELGVADHIEDVPVSLELLARQSGCDAPTLARMLRLLETAGLFQQAGDGWAHSELSRHLRSDHPNSMRAFARMIGGSIPWAALGHLKAAAQTGQPAINSVVPGGLWEHFKSHPEDARVFDAAMTSKSFAEISVLIPAFDFTPYPRIADIGGGRGHQGVGLHTFSSRDQRRPQAGLMLGFGVVREEKIDEGIRRLGGLLQRMV